MANYTFVNSEFFYLLVLPLAIVIYYALKHKSKSSTILFSVTEAIDTKPTIKQQLRHLPFVLKITVVTLMIIALTKKYSKRYDNWKRCNCY